MTTPQQQPKQDPGRGFGFPLFLGVMALATVIIIIYLVSSYIK